ncbi:MAG TPA: ABC transporter substrate-binding protein [Candidatus Binatia bacterium]|nr:ABC transporter substrate-binding protein [Candidatus Binatia bacterium]
MTCLWKAGKILFIATVLFSLSQAADAADKIRISVSSLDVAFLTSGVAYKRGFFKEEGLDVELIRMNANVSITALATGDIDYTMIFGSVVRAAVRGLPMKVVASFMDSSTHALIARPEYKSIKELRGKTLGVSSFGATADVAARMMFQKSGIDPERDIKIIALGSDRARFSALKEGIVDVAVISPPADVEGKKMGFNVVARAYEMFSFPFVGLGASNKKIKERPDEVKRAIKALIKANRFITANRDGAVQTLAEWSRSDRESAAASYDGTVKVFNADGSIPDSGLKLVIDQSKQALKVDKPVAPEEVADLGPLREAQKELGIKGR